MFFRATQLPAFAEATTAMPFPSHPSLCKIVTQRSRGDLGTVA